MGRTAEILAVGEGCQTRRGSLAPGGGSPYPGSGRPAGGLPAGPGGTLDPARSKKTPLPDPVGRAVVHLFRPGVWHYPSTTEASQRGGDIYHNGEKSLLGN